MDFHTLARKELQFLSKKNKIPANITNVAMADALTALENVVGLDEFINQSQSPEKIVAEPKTPSVTRTFNRTSTRRKPINEDLESAQPLTYSSRTTTRRRRIDQDLDQENKNLNVPETPVVPASSRRTLVASARRKVKEGSVQRVYGTRQSLRLLEKTMAGLSLKDKGREEPVKMNDLDETEEKDVFAASLEKTNDSEVSSYIELLENKEEIKDVVQQQNKSDDNSVDNQEVESQNSDCLDNHLLEVNAKDDVHGASDDMLSDKFNKSNADEMESVAVPVSKFPFETENAFAEVVEQEYCLADTDEISAKLMEDDVPDHVEAYQKKNLPFGDQLKSENDSELLLDFQNTKPQSTAADESPSNTNVYDKLDNTAAEYVEKEMIIVENVVNNPKVEIGELIDFSLIEAEVPISNEDETPEFEKQISHSTLASEESIPWSTLAVDSISERKTPGYVEYPNNTMKNLVNVYVIPAEEFGKNPTPGKQSVSGGEFTCRNPMSSLGADPLPIQFPRPTQSTPTSKKKATNEKIILVADNKENIDGSGMKAESKMDKRKKNKNIVDEDTMLKSLEDKSLRQLTKMLKEKLQINNTNKHINNEEETMDKVRSKIPLEQIVEQQQQGKTRPALQTLPENLMVIPGEPKE